MNPHSYPVDIRPLHPSAGSGWLATFPDLPGCMADGATPEAALAGGFEAAQAWLKVAEDCGDPLPQPCSAGECGRVLAHIPKSLHQRLLNCADREGVSVNTLLTALIAEGVGTRER